MKRNIALGAAWTASAAAAVGLGFLAVSLVDASASPGTTPAAATTSPSTGSATPPASPAPGATSGEHVTVGGTVFASCVGGVPSLAGAPAPGWWVDDSNDPGEVEFENGTQKVEVHTVCVGDVPQFFDEGLRTDSSGRSGSSSSPASSSSGSPSSTSGRDDSSGRSGGDDNSGRGSGSSGSDDSGGDDSSGHGSDDSGSDDSSGRSGGGHGSDD